MGEDVGTSLGDGGGLGHGLWDGGDFSHFLFCFHFFWHVETDGEVKEIGVDNGEADFWGT